MKQGWKDPDQKYGCVQERFPYKCFSFLGVVSLDLQKSHSWCILGNALELHWTV